MTLSRPLTALRCCQQMAAVLQLAELRMRAEEYQSAHDLLAECVASPPHLWTANGQR